MTPDFVKLIDRLLGYFDNQSVFKVNIFIHLFIARNKNDIKFYSIKMNSTSLSEQKIYSTLAFVCCLGN